MRQLTFCSKPIWTWPPALATLAGRAALVALTGLAGLAGLLGCAGPDARAEAPKGAVRSAAHTRLSVATLRSAKVVGDLGVPLGTLVTVEGEILPDDARRTKADLGKTLLRVRAVNGKPLPTPVIATLRGDARVRSLKPAAKVRMIAYESGGFAGAPDGLFKHVPAFTTVGFGFLTWIEVVKLTP